MDDAKEGSTRKWVNLNKRSKISGKTPKLNFGGQAKELVYKNGGELGFILEMVKQSALPGIKENVLWFTTLVSKEDNLVPIYRNLEATRGLEEYKTIYMEHGQKKSRIVAWTFQNPSERPKFFI
jgi:23S rRNA (adenine1618-N6)-methyltransferase